MLYLGFMNFLAHAYLSFGEPEVLLGNMISDCVKGKAQYTFPEGVQKGIKLHRAIDDFTDRHEAVLEAKHIFRPAYRLYSAPIIDIALDYFLANDKTIFSASGLFDFSQRTYATLEHHAHLFPLPFGLLFPYMKEGNWLFNYRTEEGIHRSIRGLIRRSSLQDDGTEACAIFSRNMGRLQQCYAALMPGVKEFAKARMNE